jgi:cyclophilin family peptidyl-prolyl cis-trans isomerase
VADDGGGPVGPTDPDATDATDEAPGLDVTDDATDDAADEPAAEAADGGADGEGALEAAPPTSRRRALVVGAVAVVVAAVVAAVLLTRSGGSSAIAAPANPGPRIGDHWHAYLGLAVCSTTYTTVPSAAPARGLFTAADGSDPGVVHIQPTSADNAGTHATVDQFLGPFGVSIAGGQILSNGTAFPTDGQCAGSGAEATTGPGRLTWTLNGTARRGDPGSYVLADGDVVLVSFNPEGQTPTPPADAAALLAHPAAHADLTTAQAQLACLATPLPPPVAQPQQFPQADQVIDPARSYTATISTSCGDITIALDAVHAPKTVNNFVFLARKGFYDGTPIHRIVPGFVVQAGDPTGQGEGGPGYTFADENLGAGYAKGTVAMANSGKGTNGEGTNGSQFFIVSSDDGATKLTPDYSVFGAVTSGDGVVALLDSFGDPASESGAPFEPLAILKVVITES